MSRAAPKPSALLLVILAALIAAGPAATQLMLPALPAVQSTFGFSTGAVQLAVSLSFFAMAIATLAWGPASVRFGRRPIVVAGLGVFIGGSILCQMAPTLPLLILGRVIQAVGAASGGITRAIVQDVYGAAGAARALSLVGMAMALAPMAAAVVGGLATDAFGWRANFFGVAAIGVAMLLLALSFLGESRVVATRSASAGWLPLRKPLFQLYALQSAISMGAFFAFIADAPHILSPRCICPPAPTAWSSSWAVSATPSRAWSPPNSQATKASTAWCWRARPWPSSPARQWPGSWQWACGPFGWSRCRAPASASVSALSSRTTRLAPLQRCRKPLVPPAALWAFFSC
jgi:DHA1 family bicyclomycin/chloramphenicol resistance-like MFS transporter